MDAFSRASGCFWLILVHMTCSLRGLEVIMFFGRDRLRAKEGVTCIRESNHHRCGDPSRVGLDCSRHRSINSHREYILPGVQGEVRCGHTSKRHMLGNGPRPSLYKRLYYTSYSLCPALVHTGTLRARAPHSSQKIEPPRLSGSACCYLGPYTQSPRQKSTGARRCRPLRRTPPG